MRQRNFKKGVWDLKTFQQYRTQELHGRSFSDHARTRYFAQAAQGAHDVTDVLRQQRGLLIGFKGARHQFGQQLAGGDAGAAGQTQFAVDGVSQLCCDVRT